MALFIPSPLRFAGYQFPAGFRLESRAQDSIIDEAQIPFFDGTNAPQGKRDSKKIHIVGALGGGGSVDSAGNFILTRDQCEAECNLMDLAIHTGYGKLFVSTINLIPDSDMLIGDAATVLTNWPDYSGSIMRTFVGAGLGGGNAIYYTGTGAASGFLYRKSLPIDVIPGQIINLSAYIDATKVTVGNPRWGIYDVPVSIAFLTLAQVAGVSGRVSSQWTVPAGVYQIVIVAATNNCTVQNAQNLFWYAPQFLAGTQTAAYVPSNLVRYLMAQKQKFSATMLEGAAQVTAEIDLMLLAQDPRWFSLRTNGLTAQAAGAEPTATNAGNALTYPQFTLTFSGAVPAVAVRVKPGSGVNYVQLTVTPPGGFVNGDVLVVDCDPRNRANAIKVNGVNHLEYLGTTGIVNTLGNAAMFPYMTGGANLAFADKVGGVANFTWAITWPDAWSY